MFTPVTDFILFSEHGLGVKDAYLFLYVCIMIQMRISVYVLCTDVFGLFV